MVTRLREDSPVPMGRNNENNGVQGLLRQLVRFAADAIPFVTMREADDETRELILDVEVDGTRYLLIRSQPRSHRAPALLSPREQEIARMVARGYPNKTIAAVLDISSWTVGTYLRRIFAKLGVSSRADMVARLLEESLLGEQSRVHELRAPRQY